MIFFQKIADTDLFIFYFRKDLHQLPRFIAIKKIQLPKRIWDLSTHLSLPYPLSSCLNWVIRHFL